MIDFKTLFISEILECGYLDVQYLEKLFEKFDVEISEIDLKGKDFNEIVSSIFYKALYNNGINPWDNRVDIFTNYLDSHLYIDGERMLSEEDIINYLQPKYNE